MSARGLVLAVVVWVCALAGVLVFACAPAWAFTFHKYESQITEVPASSGAPVTGPLGLSGSRMTVGAGDLYVNEKREGSEERATNVFAFNGSTSEYEFVSQLPQLAGLNQVGEEGIAVGTSTGETEIYQTAREAGKMSAGVVAVTNASGVLQAKWTGADTPNGSFSIEEPHGESLGVINGVAVDNSSLSGWDSGDVFVATRSTFGGSRLNLNVIDVFEPGAGGKEKYVTELTGPSPSEPFEFTQGMAVSSFNGDVLVPSYNKATETTVIDVFEPTALDTFTLVDRLSPPGGNFSGGSKGLAVDGGNGEIYALSSVASGAAESTWPGIVYEFSAAGAYLGDFSGAGTPEKAWSFSTYNAERIAVDPVSHRVLVGVYGSEEVKGGKGKRVPSAVDVFGADVTIPDVTSEAVANVALEAGAHAFSAQFLGSVNPADGGEATCWFVYGTSKSFGHEQPCEGPGESEAEPIANGNSAVRVGTDVTGLQPDTTYYYRLETKNAQGVDEGEAVQDQSFTTPGPGLSSESASEVSASSATLEATADPNLDPTSYYFQYGTVDCAVSPGECSDVPSAPAEVGSGSSPVKLSWHVQGLSADTEYNYRVVTSSELAPGEVEEFAGPDQTLLTQRPGGSRLVLPDGREWELVSPLDMHGADPLPIGEAGLAQAAAGGGAFTFLTSVPTESTDSGFGVEEQVLATRGADGWSSTDISLSHQQPVGLLVGVGKEYRFFSEDLTSGIAESFGPFSQPEGEHEGRRVVEAFPEATERTPYLRNDSTCGETPETCYTPLVTSAHGYADDSTGLPFGGNPEVNSNDDLTFVGASPDAHHVIVESSAELIPGAGGGLYEWSAEKPATERLEYVSVLPKGEVQGSGAIRLGARHGVSEDGSRVFFSDDGHLYMRDTLKRETIRLDLVEGRSEATGGNAPVFQTASTDGSVAFFTDAAPLTKGAGADGLVADLYECEIVEVHSSLTCELGDLTPLPAAGQLGAGEPADVLGSIPGASGDGGYVYFVANGVQAQGASPGDCEANGGSPADETCNLYVRHEGVTSFIATLSGEDSPDWAMLAEDNMTARVSPDGVWLAFMSGRSLTGYDNRDAKSGMPDEEVYLYDAVTKKLVCASCDPTGARPHGAKYASEDLASGDRTWPEGQWLAANIPSYTPYRLGQSLYQSRYLSDEGRLFFNSSDALVPQDTNGSENVYEYEPVGVGGSNGCSAAGSTFDAGADGCVGLISSGVAFGESAFLDASETGGEVFFLTQEKPALQGVGGGLRVYDAHECTVQSPCVAPPPAEAPECTSATSCRAAPSPQPSIYGAPSSATFSGAGNVIASVSNPAVKVKSLTRAQKLAAALKACAKKPKKKRASCEKQARGRYGAVKAKAKRARNGRGVK